MDSHNDMNTLGPQLGEDWIEPILGMPFLWLEDLQLWVAKYQVTNQEFGVFNPEHRSGEYQGYSLEGGRQPVSAVSYDDGLDFCSWLRGRFDEAGIDTQITPRMPNHLEWAIFASCGHLRFFPWGSEWPPPYGNFGDEAARRAFSGWDAIEGYDDGYPVSCPVEKSGKNEWGLYGVAGNVYEWTFESGGTGTELRGGSWSTFQKEYLALNNRYRRESSSRLFNFGMRLVLSK